MSLLTESWVILIAAVAAAAKSLQSFLTQCDPTDGSPPGSPVPGILQARTLEWVAIASSSAWKWKVKVKSLSHVPLFATPWTAAYQAPLSMRFSSKSTGVGWHCLLQILIESLYFCLTLDVFSGEEPTYQCRGHKRHEFNPWVRKIPGWRAWRRTPVFLTGESHGQKSLMGYGPESQSQTWLKWLRMHYPRIDYCINNLTY